MDFMTWPNSGIGRVNMDGSKDLGNACHTRHDFSASRSRQPENYGKCHLGTDHPQKEIYEESKHGIAYYAAPKGNVPGGMNIHKRIKWVLGKDYHAAPTYATCHMGSYKKSNGSIVKGTHNVGDRLSWTLRLAVSVKLNRATFEDGTVQNIQSTYGEKALRAGKMAMYKEYVRVGDKLVKKLTKKKIKSVFTWKQRRNNMKSGLQQHDIRYLWFKIWLHEGRRARHGATMQAPNYIHWYGMYEVSRHFYNKFLPAVIKLAKDGNMEKK